VERVAHCKVKGLSAMSCAKTAELVNLPFWLWTPVGQRKHKFNRIHQVAIMCPPMWAHWRHLANTAEPSVCGSDAVLCKITLTTCFILFAFSALTLLVCHQEDHLACKKLDDEVLIIIITYRTSVHIGNSAILKLVDIFCYLHDVLNVDGDADAAVRNGINLDNLYLCLPITMCHLL